MKESNENYGRAGGWLSPGPASSRNGGSETQQGRGYWMPVSAEMAARLIFERSDLDAELIELTNNETPN